MSCLLLSVARRRCGSSAFKLYIPLTFDPQKLHLSTSSVKDLVASSGEVGDCNQLYIPHLTLRVSVFDLSALGSCRNVAVKHGGLCEEELLPL